MPLTASVEAGKTFSDGELVTYGGINLLGLPTITISGAIAADDLPAAIISTDKLADGAVTTVKIADNAISLAKLQEADPGTLLYWDAGGTPQRLSPGNANDKLVIQNVDGGLQPRWAAPSEISDIAPSQITAGTEGYHLVSRSGVAVWEAQPTIPTFSMAWNSHTTHFNERLYNNGSFVVVGTETPTPATAASGGLDGTGVDAIDTLDTWSAGIWGDTAYKYADFTIDKTKLDTAYGSTTSSFDGDVSEIQLYAQLEIEGTNQTDVAALLYYDANLASWVPVALVGQGITAGGEARGFQSLVTVPRTESGQIKLRLALDVNGVTNVGSAGFKILAHR